MLTFFWDSLYHRPNNNSEKQNLNQLKIWNKLVLCIHASKTNKLYRITKMDLQIRILQLNGEQADGKILHLF